MNRQRYRQTDGQMDGRRDEILVTLKYATFASMRYKNSMPRYIEAYIVHVPEYVLLIIILKKT